jgi:uncharacterized lipoprotein
MMRPLPILGLLLASAVLAGCGGREAACARPGIYAEAQSIPPLRIPAGLDAPDTRGALRLPELNEPAAPRPAGSPCLESPPRYSNTAVLEPVRERRRGREESRNAPAAPPATPPASPAPAAPPAPRD